MFDLTLGIQATKLYELIINSPAGGVITETHTGASDQWFYPGTTVPLAVALDAGYTIQNWTGGASSTGADTAEIIMDSDKTVSATLDHEIVATLTATTGTSIVGDSTPIEGATVSYTSNIPAGMEFVEWKYNGVTVGTDTNDPVYAASDYSSVTVTSVPGTNFTLDLDAKNRPTVNIIQPTDMGEITITSGGAGPYSEGDTLEITVTPDEGYTVDNWTFDLVNNSLVVSPDGSYTTSLVLSDPDKAYDIGAALSVTIHELTLSNLTANSGTFSIDGSAVATGAHDLAYNTQVVVSFAPNAGFEISAWGGAASGTANTLNSVTVVMDGSKTVSVTSIVSTKESFSYRPWEADLVTSGEYKGQIAITISGALTISGAGGHGCDGLREIAVSAQSGAANDDLQDGMNDRINSDGTCKDDSLWVDLGAGYVPVTKLIVDYANLSEVPVHGDFGSTFGSLHTTWSTDRFTYTHPTTLQEADYSYRDLARNYTENAADNNDPIHQTIDQMQGHLEYTILLDVGVNFETIKFQYADKNGVRPADSAKFRGKVWVTIDKTNEAGSDYQPA
jgi:hypothetical protein